MIVLNTSNVWSAMPTCIQITKCCNNQTSLPERKKCTVLLIIERLFSLYLQQSWKQFEGMATSEEPIRQLLSRPDLNEMCKNLPDYLTSAQHQYQNLLEYLRKLKQDYPEKARILFCVTFINNSGFISWIYNWFITDIKTDLSKD